MNDSKIYEDIATRTNGDIYLGVVGPVRTGKSTFIKRFMDTMVIPNIENAYVKERAKDELPQSGSGITIMTAEPKFVPEEAVHLSINNTANFSIRLIDCVGYMVPGAAGMFEGEKERMVTTPWFDHEIPITEAAETGTNKVITDHSTIGIVVTTDGTVTEIPRTDYIEAEERVIRELKEIGKPFLVIINSSEPEKAQSLASELSKKHNVTCIAKNCLTLDADDIEEIITCILAEFPVMEIQVSLPSWFEALTPETPVKAELYSHLIESTEIMEKIKDIPEFLNSISNAGMLNNAEIASMDMGRGICSICIDIPREYFYKTISEETGFNISNDGQLISLLCELSSVKNEYDKIAPALKSVHENGYGVILPTAEEMTLDAPEIVRKGGKYGVRLKASAPSIHLLKTDIQTEVSPAVGGGSVNEEIIGLLLQEFEGDTSRIWESNLFGKSLFDIAGEDLLNKINKLPIETQSKLRTTLQRIINEGSGSIICIIL